MIKSTSWELIMACETAYFKPAHQFIHAFRRAVKFFMLIGEASL